MDPSLRIEIEGRDNPQELAGLPRMRMAMFFLDLLADSLNVTRVSSFYDFSNFDPVETKNVEEYGWRPPVRSPNGETAREWFDANAGLNSLRALRSRLEQGFGRIDSPSTSQQIEASVRKFGFSFGDKHYAEAFEEAKQSVAGLISELLIAEDVLSVEAAHPRRFHLQVSPFRTE